MSIDIEVLRTAINKLLDDTKATRGNSFDLPDDLYWFIPKESLHDPTTDPANLTLGSLDDDWAAVAAIGTGEKEPFAYGLVWASSLVRALGDRSF